MKYSIYKGLLKTRKCDLPIPLQLKGLKSTHKHTYQWSTVTLAQVDVKLSERFSPIASSFPQHLKEIW